MTNQDLRPFMLFTRITQATCLLGIVALLLFSSALAWLILTPILFAAICGVQFFHLQQSKLKQAIDSPERLKLEEARAQALLEAEDPDLASRMTSHLDD